MSAAVFISWGSVAGAQGVSHRGFLEAQGTFFPTSAVNDPRREIGEALFRQELFLSPGRLIQGAVGLDLRASSYGEVEDAWRLDLQDRGVLRPRAALRRLSATVSAGPLTLDLGKQFIRWGRADVTYPTDRFAPRDFLNVFDSELLPVMGARMSVQVGSETFEAVWVPRLTPSRLPLLDQRWTVVPAEVADVPILDGGSRIPAGSQYGARWRHISARLETAVSFFDGFNHLPDIDVRLLADPVGIELTRVYPGIRMYGADAAVPTGWFTLKLEAAYVASPSEATDEYVLYVIEIERQTGEWLLDVGYAGDVATSSRALFAFAPDRGVARSIIGRAAYTVDPQRTVALEGAVRQRGEGFYVKVEYSQAFGQHWRLTLSGIGIGGDESDFLGQYRHNSHGSLALRFSF